MPHYFFDSRDGDEFTEDDTGLVCRDIEYAKVEAARALAEIALDIVPGSVRRVLTIEVRDEHGPVLETSMIFEVRVLRSN